MTDEDFLLPRKWRRKLYFFFAPLVPVAVTLGVVSDTVAGAVVAVIASVTGGVGFGMAAGNTQPPPPPPPPAD